MAIVHIKSPTQVSGGTTPDPQPTTVRFEEWNEEVLEMVLHDAWGHHAEARITRKEWELIKKAGEAEFAELERYKR